MLVSRAVSYKDSSKPPPMGLQIYNKKLLFLFCKQKSDSYTLYVYLFDKMQFKITYFLLSHSYLPQKIKITHLPKKNLIKNVSYIIQYFTRLYTKNTG